MAGEIFHLIWEVPSGKWAVRKKFIGLWRITEIQGFDAGYVDLCGPAKLKITTRGWGSINFGAVEAEIDCKMDDLDKRVVRFSFGGRDEGAPIYGRGYCVVDGDRMTGRIFRHLGDEFGFKASRLPKEKNG